jgi:TRAP-type uncharacterized transport system fused permease subunit
MRRRGTSPQYELPFCAVAISAYRAAGVSKAQTIIIGCSGSRMERTCIFMIAWKPVLLLSSAIYPIAGAVIGVMSIATSDALQRQHRPSNLLHP